MEFNTFYSPPPVDYSENASGYIGGAPGGPQAPAEKIESKVSIDEIGQTVTEGSRFGSLLKTSQDSIKLGTSKVELQLQMGGGAEPVGAENYGQEARQALREISRVNQIEFTSVHAPTQVGNLSGFNGQQGSFSNQQRRESIEEIKKAVRFAADVTGGGGVVVHTGEFQRDMTEMGWNKEGKKATSVDEYWDDLTGKQRRYVKEQGYKDFLSFPEEDSEQVHYLVDDRTGKLIQDVRKSMVVFEPRFKKDPDAKAKGRKYAYVDKDGNPLTLKDAMSKRDPIYEGGEFKTDRLTWDNFVEMADEYNKFDKNPGEKDKTPAEMFIWTRMQNQIMQSKGLAKYYDRGYKQMGDMADSITKQQNALSKADEDSWSAQQKIHFLTGMSHEIGMGEREILGMVQQGMKPSEILQQRKDEVLKQRQEIFDMSSSYVTNSKEAEDNLKHIKPVDVYAKDQTLKSYAELGIYAMEETAREGVDKPIFIAPENIFPEMGYGSHPEEMIELVKSARGKMADFLCEKEIEDPHGMKDKDGNVRMVPNPYYEGITRKKAEEKAKDHIRATLDTQHMGMWWKHFQPLPSETTDQRRKRFDKWYMKMIKKMEKEEVIGHIHLVDSLGGGHHHLPVGQGNLPLVKAIEYLKGEKWDGTIVSEAHGEESLFGQGRMMTKTWEAFGSPIKGSTYGISAPSPRWGDVHAFYGSQLQSPYFMFGSYVPSNDWRLWSDVPFE